MRWKKDRTETEKTSICVLKWTQQFLTLQHFPYQQFDTFPNYQHPSFFSHTFINFLHCWTTKNSSLFLETLIWNWNLSPPLAWIGLQVLSWHSYHQSHSLHNPLWTLHLLLINLNPKHNLKLAQCLLLLLPRCLSKNLSLFHHVTRNPKTSHDSLLPHRNEPSHHSSHGSQTSSLNATLIQ